MRSSNCETLDNIATTRKYHSKLYNMCSEDYTRVWWSDIPPETYYDRSI